MDLAGAAICLFHGWVNCWRTGYPGNEAHKSAFQLSECGDGEGKTYRESECQKKVFVIGRYIKDGGRPVPHQFESHFQITSWFFKMVNFNLLIAPFVF
jgi:hypothetical protein